jgi:hypothetical protein
MEASKAERVKSGRQESRESEEVTGRRVERVKR